MFILGAPDQYFYNDAFKLKVVFLVLMGANAALFYWREFAGIRALGPHDDAPRSAKSSPPPRSSSSSASCCAAA